MPFQIQKTPLMDRKLELAAALFSVLGAEIPHQTELEQEAADLFSSLGSRSKTLKKILELCESSDSPQALYLSAKACAWLGSGYRRQNVEFAARYLQGPPWQALPSGVAEQNGLKFDRAAAVRADLLRDMAQAELILGDVRDAHSHYMAACRLEPHNAMNYVKAAEAVEKQSGREEALRFLLEQRKNAWFTPVKYRDSAGKLCTNDLFQELLNANIRKLEQQKEPVREESPLY